MVVEILIATLVLTGAAFMLLGSIGLARLPDFYTRLHGPTKATTLGIGSILLASALLATERSGTLSLREGLIALFLGFTAPVTAYLLAQAARHRGAGARPAREPGARDAS